MQNEAAAPLAITSQEFRTLGHQLVDRIAALLDSLPNRPVTTAETPAQIREALNSNRTLPQQGTDASALLDHAANLPLRALPL